MEIINEFGINPILLLAQIINFTILVVLLKKLLYKPILKILEERKTKIANSLKDAEEIEKRLLKISQEQESILNKARLEAKKIVSDAKLEAKQLTQESLEQTKASINDLLETNQKRLTLEREKMMREARAHLAEIVVIAASVVTKKQVSADINSNFIKEAIEKISKNGIK